MKLFGRELTGFAKATVVLAAVLLLGIGLCSIDAAVEKTHGWSIVGPDGGGGFPHTALATFVGFLDWVGALTIVVALFGLLIEIGFVVIRLLASVYRKLARPDRDRHQALPPDAKADNEDEGETQ